MTIFQVSTQTRSQNQTGKATNTLRDVQGMQGRNAPSHSVNDVDIDRGDVCIPNNEEARERIAAQQVVFVST